MSYFNTKNTSIVLSTNALISRLSSGDVSIFDELSSISDANIGYVKNRILKNILMNKNKKFLLLYVDKYGVPGIANFIKHDWLEGVKILIDHKAIKHENSRYFQADKYFAEAFKNKKYDFVLELIPRVNSLSVLLGLKPGELKLAKADLRNSTIVLAKRDNQDELALKIATTAYNTISAHKPDSILCKTLRNMIDVLTRVPC